MTADQLAALHALAFTVPRPWGAAEFTALLASPHVILVAEPDGFALGRVIADEAELLTIAVHPAARRRGVGRRLLTELIDQTASRGAGRMFLEVSAENDSAIALYLRAGFTQVALRKSYFTSGDRRIDALVLQRILGAAN